MKWGAENQNQLALGRIRNPQPWWAGMDHHLGLSRGEYWALGLASNTDPWHIRCDSSPFVLSYEYNYLLIPPRLAV
jgi:hypothetical protein